MLQAEAASKGSISVRLDGRAVTLTAGKHFFIGAAAKAAAAAAASSNAAQEN